MKTKPTFEWVAVTPALATQWLEGNVHNRPIRDNMVLRYATSMRAGLWHDESPEAIMFDTGGWLINGQHRLWAVIESARTVEFAVARGVDPAVQLVLDQGSVRSAHDNINLRKDKDDETPRLTSDDIAVLRAVVSGRVKLNVPVEFCERLWPVYEPAIRFAKEAFGGRVAPPALVMVRAVVARAFFTKNPERLRRFCGVLLTGVTDRSSEGAGIKLRDVLIGEWRNCAIRPSRYTMWGKIESALENFIVGKTPSKLMALEREAFEIPAPALLVRLREITSEAAKRRLADKPRVKASDRQRGKGIVMVEAIVEVVAKSATPLTIKQIAKRVKVTEKSILATSALTMAVKSGRVVTGCKKGMGRKQFYSKGTGTPTEAQPTS